LAAQNPWVNEKSARRRATATMATAPHRINVTDLGTMPLSMICWVIAGMAKFSTDDRIRLKNVPVASSQ